MSQTQCVKVGTSRLRRRGSGRDTTAMGRKVADGFKEPIRVYIGRVLLVCGRLQ